MRLTKRSPKKPEKSRFPSRKGDGPGRKFHSPTGNAPPDDRKQRSDRHGNRTLRSEGRNRPREIRTKRMRRPPARAPPYRPPGGTPHGTPPARYAARAETGQPTTGNDRIAGRTPQTDRQDNRPDDLPKCGCAETTGGTSPSRETSRPSLSGCRRNYFSAPAFFGSAFTLSEAKPSTIFASSFFDAS